ncbi:hypothetical protein SLE2022_253030 [Rubroshorea leprosula]
MHSIEVNAHVKALRTLCKRKALSFKEANILVTKWVKFLSKASDILEKYISETSEANMNGSIFTPPRTGDRKGKQAATASRMLPKAITAVYTIGSLVIICPADMSFVIPLLYTINFGFKFK